ncbi:MAG: hypothetical protein RL538_355 [Candidatus Parcubacteria bacterium]
MFHHVVVLWVAGAHEARPLSLFASALDANAGRDSHRTPPVHPGFERIRLRSGLRTKVGRSDLRLRGDERLVSDIPLNDLSTELAIMFDHLEAE